MSEQRSPEYLSGYQAGFVDGYFTDSEHSAPIVAILLDLIAELAAADGPPVWVANAVTRAEARLREVAGEAPTD